MASFLQRLVTYMVNTFKFIKNPTATTKCRSGAFNDGGAMKLLWKYRLFCLRQMEVLGVATSTNGGASFLPAMEMNPYGSNK